MTPIAAFHLLPGASDADLTWAATGAQLVKVADAKFIAPAQALGARVVYRAYLPDDGDCPDGTQWADRVVEAIQTTRAPWPEMIGFRNELQATAANVMAYRAYRTVLRQAGYRGIVLFGSFSVGVPDWPEWEAMRDAWGGDRPDAIELHEYFDLTVTGSAPWYTLRCIEAIKRGYLPTDMPFLIGEFGSDAIGVEDSQKRGGWRSKMSDTVAADQLRAYLKALDGTACLGVCWFADGQNPGQWGDYTARGTAIETAIRATWTVASPPAPQPAAQTPIPPVLYPITTTTPTVSMPLTIPQIHRIGGHPMPVQTPIAFMQPASSADCWADNGRRFFTRYGIITDLEIWYQVAKGKSRPPGGEPATFGELKAAIITVAEHQGIIIGVAPASYQSGYAYLQMLDCTDPGQVSACLDDPDVHNPWSIIAGINAWDLGMLNADGSRATWGHYITLRKRQADDATYIWVFDPANQWNGDSAQTYPWADIVTAMADNWTGPNGLDAIAVKVVEVE